MLSKLVFLVLCILRPKNILYDINGNITDTDYVKKIMNKKQIPFVELWNIFLQKSWLVMVENIRLVVVGNFILCKF